MLVRAYVRRAVVKFSFSKMASRVSKAAGHPAAFMSCLGLMIVWAGFGPVMKYSDAWQLYANTPTTLVTTLMVFLIQNSQNRDGAALQAKLDELLRAINEADDKLIGLDQREAGEIDAVRAAALAATSA